MNRTYSYTSSMLPALGDSLLNWLRREFGNVSRALANMWDMVNNQPLPLTPCYGCLSSDTLTVMTSLTDGTWRTYQPYEDSGLAGNAATDFQTGEITVDLGGLYDLCFTLSFGTNNVQNTNRWYRTRLYNVTQDIGYPELRLYYGIYSQVNNSQNHKTVRLNAGDKIVGQFAHDPAFPLSYTTQPQGAQLVVRRIAE